MTSQYQALIPSIIQIGKQASEAVLTIYHASDSEYGVSYKSDHSPVTQADLAAHHKITHALELLTPDWPVVSEESKQLPSISEQSTFWLIDPIDGTKEFIAGTDEFTINIALVVADEPVLGVVIVPAKQEIYWGVKGEQAYWQQAHNTPEAIRVSQLQPGDRDPLRITVSRRHHNSDKMQQVLDSLDNYEIISCGSALKICLVARGIADVYPRFGPTSKWDTAAGHCILEAAGGHLIDMEGNPLRYNINDSLRNPKFLACNSTKWLKLLPQ